MLKANNSFSQTATNPVNKSTEWALNRSDRNIKTYKASFKELFDSANMLNEFPLSKKESSNILDNLSVLSGKSRHTNCSKGGRRQDSIHDKTNLLDFDEFDDLASDLKDLTIEDPKNSNWRAATRVAPVIEPRVISPPEEAKRTDFVLANDWSSDFQLQQTAPGPEAKKTAPADTGYNPFSEGFGQAVLIKNESTREKFPEMKSVLSKEDLNKRRRVQSASNNIPREFIQQPQIQTLYQNISPAENPDRELARLKEERKINDQELNNLRSSLKSAEEKLEKLLRENVSIKENAENLFKDVLESNRLRDERVAECQRHTKELDDYKVKVEIILLEKNNLKIQIEKNNEEFKKKTEQLIKQLTDLNNKYEEALKEQNFYRFELENKNSDYDSLLEVNKNLEKEKKQISEKVETLQREINNIKQEQFRTNNLEKIFNTKETFAQREQETSAPIPKRSNIVPSDSRKDLLQYLNLDCQEVAGQQQQSNVNPPPNLTEMNSFSNIIKKDSKLHEKESLYHYETPQFEEDKLHCFRFKPHAASSANMPFCPPTNSNFEEKQSAQASSFEANALGVNEQGNITKFGPNPILKNEKAPRSMSPLNNSRGKFPFPQQIQKEVRFHEGVLEGGDSQRSVGSLIEGEIQKRPGFQEDQAKILASAKQLEPPELMNSNIKEKMAFGKIDLNHTRSLSEFNMNTIRQKITGEKKEYNLNTIAKKPQVKPPGPGFINANAKLSQTPIESHFQKLLGMKIYQNGSGNIDNLKYSCLMEKAILFEDDKIQVGIISKRIQNDTFTDFEILLHLGNKSSDESLCFMETSILTDQYNLIKNIPLERTMLKPKSHVKQDFYLSDEEIGSHLLLYNLSFSRTNGREREEVTIPLPITILKYLSYSSNFTSAEFGQFWRDIKPNRLRSLPKDINHKFLRNLSDLKRYFGEPANLMRISEKDIKSSKYKEKFGVIATLPGLPEFYIKVCLTHEGKIALSCSTESSQANVLSKCQVILSTLEFVFGKC